MNFLKYNSGLKKLTFDKLKFKVISTEKVKEVCNENNPDKLEFKKGLLDVFTEECEFKVLKYMILLTPKQPKYDGFGFLYLENNMILPIKITPSKNYLDWHKIITNVRYEIIDWLVIFSKDLNTMSGMSHVFKGESFGLEDYELYQETGTFLYDNAPREFNKKKTNAEKNKYLKKYLLKEGFESQHCITDIIRYKDVLSPFTSKLKSPLENIEPFTTSFLKLTGIKLPIELEILYTMCNGSLILNNEYSILSSEELLNAIKMWRNIYDEWILSELKVHKSDAGKTLPMYTTPYWIPFMTDQNGNYIALDFIPDKKGLKGQVIVFGADEHVIKVLSNNFVDFLESLQEC